MSTPEFDKASNWQVKDGLIKDAIQLPSPNYNVRPAGEKVSLLVIHNISLPPGKFATGQVQKFFTNKLDASEHEFFQQIADVKVSAHLFIERTGVVTQFVNFNQRAWHAGKSMYKDIEGCNDFSIGIELEGTDRKPYTPAQYGTLHQVILGITEAYPEITLDRIVGHCDVAPIRKSDPGESFDWQRLYQGLAASGLTA